MPFLILFLFFFVGATIMPRKSKRTQLLQSIRAKSRYRQRAIRLWENQVESLEECDLFNPKVRTRTREENKCLILAMKMVLKLHLNLVKNNQPMSVFDISWTMIQKIVASEMGVGINYLRLLTKQIIKDGDVMVFGEDSDKKKRKQRKR